MKNILFSILTLLFSSYSFAFTISPGVYRCDFASYGAPKSISINKFNRTSIALEYETPLWKNGDKVTIKSTSTVTYYDTFFLRDEVWYLGNDEMLNASVNLIYHNSLNKVEVKLGGAYGAYEICEFSL